MNVAPPKESGNIATKRTRKKRRLRRRKKRIKKLRILRLFATTLAAIVNISQKSEELAILRRRPKTMILEVEQVALMPLKRKGTSVTA